MSITIVNAKNPRRVEWDRTAIVLDVLFSHQAEAIPFAARADDLEPHGQELFARAIQGEYGDIVEVPTPAQSVSIAVESATLRERLMRQCIEKVQHWEMMGEFTAAMEWRHYYQALAMLEKTETWPIVEIWPTAPEE